MASGTLTEAFGVHCGMMFKNSKPHSGLKVFVNVVLEW